MILCPDCGKKYRMKKMGVMCQELLEDGSHYRFFSGDLFQCSCCKREVITGFGNPIYAEDYKYNVDYQFK